MGRAGGGCQLSKPRADTAEGKRMTEIDEKRAVWNVCCHSAIKQASRRLGQLYDDVLAPSGLRITQYSLLAQIDVCPGVSPKQLASGLVMDLSALGHTLKPLIRDGLIRTNPDPSDRRAKQLHLTKKGKTKRDEAAVLWRDAQRRLEEVFGKDDAAAMRGVMNRVSSRDFEESFLRAGTNGRSSSPSRADA
jgi:DNA-binding MarR family transcriptional regulator